MKQAEDSIRKADKDFHEVCQKAEQARQEWETNVYKVRSIDRYCNESSSGFSVLCLILEHFTSKLIHNHIA